MGCPHVPAWWCGAVQRGPVSLEHVLCVGRTWGRDRTLPEITPRE